MNEKKCSFELKTAFFLNLDFVKSRFIIPQNIHQALQLIRLRI